MTLTRQAAIEQAATLLDHLERIVENEGRCVISVEGLEIGPITALRALLVQRAANVLQGTEANSSEPLDPKRSLFVAKQWVTARALAARGYADSFAPANGAQQILAIPRHGNHLRDMLPVAQLASTEHHLKFSWLAFRRDHFDEVRRTGDPCVLVPAYANSLQPERVTLHARLVLALRNARKNKPQTIDGERWSKLVEAIGSEAHAQLGGLIEAVRAVERAFRELKPSLVLIGNACSMEGIIAGLIARRKNIPAASMQHGEINSTHVEWARAVIDLVTVWGPGPKDRLVRLGVSPDRVVVAGAPWVDQLAASKQRATKGRRRILIALSGAGHSVGMTEHLTHVRLLMEAAAALPEHEWVFRLHPKDDVAIYQRAALASGANVSVVESSAAPDIHADLAHTDLLVTVTSASALDAMLHAVPVLTLGRPEGEARPAFVDAGATVHAPWLESLEKYVREALENPSAELFARAKQCVETQFGPLDGGATGRVVSALRSLFA